MIKSPKPPTWLDAFFLLATSVLLAVLAMLVSVLGGFIGHIIAHAAYQGWRVVQPVIDWMDKW